MNQQELIRHLANEMRKNDELEKAVANLLHDGVCYLWLCEANRLVLRPNQLYFFSVDESCPACLTAAKEFLP